MARLFQRTSIVPTWAVPIVTTFAGAGFGLAVALASGGDFTRDSLTQAAVICGLIGMTSGLALAVVFDEESVARRAVREAQAMTTANDMVWEEEFPPNQAPPPPPVPDPPHSPGDEGADTATR